jgi:biotin carboxyl carrier protein
MRYFVTLNGTSQEIEVEGEGPYRIVHGDAPSETLEAEVFGSGNRYRVYLNGKVIELLLENERSGHVEINGRRLPVTVRDEREGAPNRKQKASNGATRTINAQMPGRILQVRVGAGAQVNPGNPLVVIEAMKMENEICADAEGTVESVLVRPGDAVEAGAPLLTLK